MALQQEAGGVPGGSTLYLVIAIFLAPEEATGWQLICNGCYHEASFKNLTQIFSMPRRNL
jgi:hypothetical protein